jgi:HAE1 family hydrophobic/amphiphilic exporter-1
MIDWAGISADEVSQGNQAIWVFLICLGLLFGFSSTIRKFYSALIRNSIITSGIFGAFLLLKLTGLENNIYAQVPW